MKIDSPSNVELQMLYESLLPTRTGLFGLSQEEGMGMTFLTKLYYVYKHVQDNITDSDADRLLGIIQDLCRPAPEVMVFMDDIYDKGIESKPSIEDACLNFWNKRTLSQRIKALLVANASLLIKTYSEIYPE
jgi:hypothetical protein